MWFGMNAYEVTCNTFRDALLFAAREEERLKLFESTALKIVGTKPEVITRE
jgi:hypothetical protein